MRMHGFSRHAPRSSFSYVLPSVMSSLPLRRVIVLYFMEVFMYEVFTLIGIAAVFGVFIPLLLYLIFGGFFYLIRLKKIGHWFFAQAMPGSLWLVDHCPHTDCKRCRSWTCPAYDKKHHHLCKCCSHKDAA